MIVFKCLTLSVVIETDVPAYQEIEEPSLRPKSNKLGTCDDMKIEKRWPLVAQEAISPTHEWLNDLWRRSLGQKLLGTIQ